jgi:hypothetical protein
MVIPATIPLLQGTVPMPCRQLTLALQSFAKRLSHWKIRNADPPTTEIFEIYNSMYLSLIIISLCLLDCQMMLYIVSKFI